MKSRSKQALIGQDMNMEIFASLVNEQNKNLSEHIQIMEKICKIQTDISEKEERISGFLRTFKPDTSALKREYEALSNDFEDMAQRSRKESNRLFRYAWRYILSYVVFILIAAISSWFYIKTNHKEYSRYENALDAALYEWAYLADKAKEAKLYDKWQEIRKKEDKSIQEKRIERLAPIRESLLAE